jgi:N-acetylglucosaminyldiphosphoundecaprenol N-acetyl-beta-D-mannosaminyltransferase
MQAQHDAGFRTLINASDLATPDGAGIILAGRLLGRPFRGRTTGVALTERLAALAADRGYRLFLLGAAPGVAAEAGRIWSSRYPGLHVAGAYPGSPAADEADEITARITASGADLLFVAFGAPAQDRWIADYAGRLPTVRLALGVGGVFDYLTGRVPLAPPIWRQLGLEWLYRLYHQPWRWRRMLALPRFVLAVLGQRFGVGI